MERFTRVPQLLCLHLATLGVDCTLLGFLVVLLSYDRGNGVFPSVGRLARQIGASPDTVRRYVVKLEQLGLIRVEARYDEERQLTNLYDLTPLWFALRRIAGEESQRCEPPTRNAAPPPPVELRPEEDPVEPDEMNMEVIRAVNQVVNRFNLNYRRREELLALATGQDASVFVRRLRASARIAECSPQRERDLFAALDAPESRPSNVR